MIVYKLANFSDVWCCRELTHNSWTRSDLQLKGMVLPKKINFVIIYPHIVPNLYDVLSRVDIHMHYTD